MRVATIVLVLGVVLAASYGVDIETSTADSGNLPTKGQLDESLPNPNPIFSGYGQGIQTGQRAGQEKPGKQPQKTQEKKRDCALLGYSCSRLQRPCCKNLTCERSSGSTGPFQNRKCSVSTVCHKVGEPCGPDVIPLPCCKSYKCRQFEQDGLICISDD